MNWEVHFGLIFVGNLYLPVTTISVQFWKYRRVDKQVDTFI